MSKSEKNAFFSKPFNGPILIFWNLILYTFLCTKIKKITIVNFFSLDACSRPMWPTCVLFQKRKNLFRVQNGFVSKHKALCFKIASFGKCFWNLAAFFWTSSHFKAGQNAAKIFFYMFLEEMFQKTWQPPVGSFTKRKRKWLNFRKKELGDWCRGKSFQQRVLVFSL